MIADHFQRQMIRHHHPETPAMTIKGTIITISLIATLVYVVIDCRIF